MKISVSATVMVCAMDINGEYRCGRSLFSSAHDANLITLSFANELGAIRTYGVQKAFEFNGKTLWAFGKVILTVRNYAEPIEFFVVAELNYITPVMEVDPRFVTSMTSPVHLADPDFHRSRGVDCILGSDVSMKCINGESQEYPNGLILLETVFGKVVTGVAHSP